MKSGILWVFVVLALSGCLRREKGAVGLSGKRAGTLVGALPEAKRQVFGMEFNVGTLGAGVGVHRFTTSEAPHQVVPKVPLSDKSDADSPR